MYVFFGVALTGVLIDIVSHKHSSNRFESITSAIGWLIIGLIEWFVLANLPDSELFSWAIFLAAMAPIIGRYLVERIINRRRAAEHVRQALKWEQQPTNNNHIARNLPAM